MNIKKLIGLLLLVVAPSWASVIVDSQTTSGLTANFEKVTWPMSIGTGLNRLLTVGCAQNGGSTVAISSASVDLSTMTRVRSHATFPDRMEMWYLTSPSTGTHTITMWLTGSGLNGGETICGGISFENVNISSPIATSSASATGTVTWNVPSSTTMLVDIDGQSSNTSDVIPNTSQTLRWLQTYSARFTSQGGSTKSGGNTSGDKTMAWTQSPGGVVIAMAVNTSTSAPEVSSISPNTKGIGELSFTLTVNGSNFVSGASVTWNGSNRATTFVNSAQLTAAITASDIANIASIPVRVINPDTARSENVAFSVTGDITRVWVGDGGYKPVQDDLFGTAQSTTVASTRIWDGHTARPFQAKNEINGFPINLENNTSINSSSVSVRYPVLTGPGGYVISSTQPTVSNWHDWRNRPIQLYKTGYLKIDGVSRIWWEDYDENHVPVRFRRPCTINPVNGGCVASGGWTDRPDHDKYYPDPLIPLEAIVGSTFTIYSSSSQAIWVDVYIPKDAPAGEYTGQVNVYEGTTISTSIPISLTVYPFTMPDTPPSGAYALISGVDINRRFYGDTFAAYDGANGPKTTTRLNHMRFLKRFGIIPIGDGRDGGCDSLVDTKPCPEYQAALNGTLYSPTSGYAMAPGVNTPDNFYMMFSYGQWNDAGSVWDETFASFCANALTWVNYMQTNFPKAEYRLYIEDEVADLTRANKISTWVSSCTAPANQMPTFITGDARSIRPAAPNMSAFATTQSAGISYSSEADQKYFATKNGKRIDYYNGTRPWMAGSGVIEFDGVDARVAPWMQYKKKYDRYFQWHANYWWDSNNQGYDTSMFTDAHTFGYQTQSANATYGRTGFNFNNGDGILFYPGSDVIFSSYSLHIDGPIPSWRLMMLRRGINDFTYLTMAAQYDPKAVDAIVRRILPKVLWEYGIFDPNDPTYQYTSASWPDDPDVWERAREELAKIISRHR